ncbi:MAG: ABC-2 family transporter protein, partial [Gemmatimonadota bacterium]
SLLDRTTTFPLSLYAYWVQLALTFAVPIGFISFYPAAGLLERGDLVALPFAVAAWTPVVGLVFFLVASAVFARGLARYTSAGS